MLLLLLLFPLLLLLLLLLLLFILHHLLLPLTTKDVDGSNHNVPSLNIILQDFRKEPNKQVGRNKSKTVLETNQNIDF